MAISSIVCSDLVPLKKRALYQGLANIFYGCGSGLGGPFGGLISDLWGWRAAFLCEFLHRISLFLLGQTWSADGLRILKSPTGTLQYKFRS